MNRHRRFWILASALFTALAIYGSLVPLRLRPLGLAEAVEKFKRIEYLQLSIGSRQDWASNLWLFVPIGFLWSTSFTSRRIGRRVATACCILPLGCLVAVGLEFTQLWFPPRTVSLNDIYAECLGVTVGVIMALAIGNYARDWVERALQSTGEKRWPFVLQAYLVLGTLFLVFPLDFVLNYEELQHKVELGRVRILPAISLRDGVRYVLVLMSYLPFGAAICALQEPRVRSGTPKAAVAPSILWGILFCAAIELVRLPIYTRTFDALTIFLGSLGCAVGVLAWSRRAEIGLLVAQSPIIWFAAFFVGAILLVGIHWAPFQLENSSLRINEKLQVFFRMPGVAQWRSSEFAALSTSLLRLAALGTLGGIAWLTVRTTHENAGACSLLLLCVGCLTSLSIEVGQIWFKGPVPDLTTGVLGALAFCGGMGFASQLVPRKRLMADG